MNSVQDQHKERLLRRPEVLARTGVGKSKLCIMIREGEFPAPLKLGSRTSVWPESWVDAWIGRIVEQQPVA